MYQMGPGSWRSWWNRRLIRWALWSYLIVMLRQQARLCRNYAESTFQTVDQLTGWWMARSS
jgi:hypothetical protein